MQLDRILPPREAWHTAGISRSTMYRLEKAGRFPRRLQISEGRTGYLASELEAWLKGRAALRKVLEA
ncbi:MAG TPA: AlpA family phage regulatory protein [Thermomonas sp.]|nr:AlpA family phage regulatory protein [Thermomonas sp.]